MNKVVEFYGVSCGMFTVRGVVRTGATGAIAPVDFQKGLIAAVDFEELRYEKNFMTPIESTNQDKPICTLEFMVWPIRTGRNLSLKK